MVELAQSLEAFESLDSVEGLTVPAELPKLAVQVAVAWLGKCPYPIELPASVAGTPALAGLGAPELALPGSVLAANLRSPPGSKSVRCLAVGFRTVDSWVAERHSVLAKS